MEALEVGATSLFIDEDTCATNFMIRDDVRSHLPPIACFACPVFKLGRRLGTLVSRPPCLLGRSASSSCHRVIMLLQTSILL